MISVRWLSLSKPGWLPRCVPRGVADAGSLLLRCCVAAEGRWRLDAHPSQDGLARLAKRPQRPWPNADKPSLLASSATLAAEHVLRGR